MLNRLPVLMVTMFLYACLSHDSGSSSSSAQTQRQCGCGGAGTCGDKGQVSFTGPDVAPGGWFSHDTVKPTVVGGTQIIQVNDLSGASGPITYSDGNNYAFDVVGQSAKQVTIAGRAAGSGQLRVYSGSALLDTTTLEVRALAHAQTIYSHVSSLPLALLAGGQLTLRHELRDSLDNLLVDSSLQLQATNAVVTTTKWYEHHLAIAKTTGTVDIDIKLAGQQQPTLSFPLVPSIEALTTTNEAGLEGGVLRVNSTIEFCAYATGGGYEVDGVPSLTVAATGAAYVYTDQDTQCYTLVGSFAGPAQLRITAGALERHYDFEVAYVGADLGATADLGGKD